MRGGFGYAVNAASDVVSILVETAEQQHMGSVMRFDDGNRCGHLANLAPGAQSVFQDIGDIGWERQVETCREVITAHPDLMDQAVVANAPAGSLWAQVGQYQKLPGLREKHVRYNQHLLATHVPDAHGIQVLTDEHLAAAADLSRWAVTDLGHDRHLVEAPDLAPWYAQKVPDPATLEQARQDFGPMILTLQTIEAHPPPWAPRRADRPSAQP